MKYCPIETNAKTAFVNSEFCVLKEISRNDLNSKMSSEYICLSS